MARCSSDGESPGTRVIGPSRPACSIWAMAWWRTLLSRVLGGRPHVEWVDPDTLHMGPVQHATFTPEQDERIGRLHSRLASIDGWTLDKRRDLFSRDLNLDRELGIIERIADASEAAYAEFEPLTSDQRRELYGLASAGLGAPAEALLKRYRPKHISAEQARWILQRVTAE